jgi:GNAT superfamily N-acetyltransferase
MTVLFKNLTTRKPKGEDQVALTELVGLCEGGEEDVVKDVLSRWRPGEVQESNNAWVIVTTSGQLVGFACVWCEDRGSMRMYFCVRPEYRSRGIGTLLLRMAEMRARQLARQYPSSERVVLRGMVHSASVEARHLCEREGYRSASSFLRISFALSAEESWREERIHTHRFTVDIDLERRNQPLDATALSEQDVLCVVRRYGVYEKELRPATCEISQRPGELQALSA